MGEQKENKKLYWHSAQSATTEQKGQSSTEHYTPANGNIRNKNYVSEILGHL